MQKIKYATLVDFILEALIEKRQQVKNKFWSLTALVDYFDYNMPYSDIIGLGKYFDTIGWAKVVFMLGDVKLQINTKGIMHIEEKGKEFYQEYLNYVAELKRNGKKEINEIDELGEPKGKIINLIDQISKKIEINEGKGTDRYKDLEIVKLELDKSVPDFRTIEEKLSRFNNIMYLFDDIQELKDFVSNGSALSPYPQY